MTISCSRRGFLRSAATAGLALAASPALAIDPITRTGGPKFKFSLAAYSYRKLLQGKQAKLTLFDFVDDCARMNLEGTELTSYYFPVEPSAEYLSKLKGHCFRQGLDISGTAVGNDFCVPSAGQRQVQIDDVKRWIERADAIDAPVIRIFSGGVRPGQSVEQAKQLAIEAIQTCCEYAGQHGVFLALENHGGLTAKPEEMLELVRAIDSPWFGVNLDTGNFHTRDVYADLAKLAPYALNVQVKVVIKPEGKSSEPTDFKKLAAILRDVNYQGYVVLEYEENEDPREACPRYIDQLREAFA